MEIPKEYSTTISVLSSTRDKLKDMRKKYRHRGRILLETSGQVVERLIKYYEENHPQEDRSVR